MPYICSSYDHEKFIDWQFNCCNQTAMVVHEFLLRQSLVDVIDPKIFVIKLKDPIIGIYEHAYNKCKIFKDQKSLLIDVSTVSYKTLVQTGRADSLNLASIRSIEAGYTIKEISNVQIFPSNLEEYEYFTGLPTKEFIDLCLAYHDRYKA